jgi:hypothetical protein
MYESMKIALPPMASQARAGQRHAARGGEEQRAAACDCTDEGALPFATAPLNI